MMMKSLEEVYDAFGLKDEDILNVYAYGSQVYGTSTVLSDHDFIIVHKSAMLEDGSFKQNARSSPDRKIQGINYSRGGFKAGLENYEINCIECMFLEPQYVLKKKWPFRIEKYNEKEFAKNIISKVSASWHSAILALKDDDIIRARKGFYHSMRILDFAKQLKENKFQSLDFSTAKSYKIEIGYIEPMDLFQYVKTKLIPLRDEMFEDLRK